MWMTLFQVSKTPNLLLYKALSFGRVSMPANRGIDSEKNDFAFNLLSRSRIY
jgi:hypothetical protein